MGDEDGSGDPRSEEVMARKSKHAKPTPTEADPAATVIPKRATDEDGESVASGH